VSPSRWPQLAQVARRSLERNIVTLAGKGYLVAGAHQFKSLWTRDFGWSVRGLLALGRADVVKNQLEALLANVRQKDGVLPRTLDSSSAKLRVALATAHDVLPLIPGEIGISAKLKPEYLDQYGHIAFDGNLLAVLAARQYVDATKDKAFWAAHKTQLGALLRFYGRHLRKDGLLHQPAFSDWQDSVKRQGASFYMNMLYARTLEVAGEDAGVPGAKRLAAQLRATIERTFKDPATGLYRSMARGKQISLDGNLLALDTGFVPMRSAKGRQLFAALRNSALWTAPNGPGFTTIPPYPEREKSPMVRLAGVGGYHDTLYWSWEMALAGKLAARMGYAKDADAIFGQLSKMAARDGVVGEIYEPKDGLPPKRSLLYHSEQPFSWGAAFVVDALA